MKYDLITILGPTASGKTQLAVNTALAINGEILSADSRQVYKGMDIGTGKDLNEYETKQGKIEYHLIDIINPGEEYNLFNFQQDFYIAYNKILLKQKTPILCGGTGLYIDCILDNYDLIEVPINENFRGSIKDKPDNILLEKLKQLKELHNVTDSIDRERIVRALEINMFKEENPNIRNNFPKLKSIIFGIDCPRSLIKERIQARLVNRLNNGMIEEVKQLLDDGVDANSLIKYGLEYKFITQFLLNHISNKEMIEKLYIAICDFSKRQMTWFRRMEKKGHNIIWIDINLSLAEKTKIIYKHLQL